MNMLIFRGVPLVFLIPLILSIGIIPAIQFSDAVEYSQICINKVWVESTNNRIACVTPSTAEKLVERGWGKILAHDTFEEVSIEEPSKGESSTYCSSGVSKEAREIYLAQNPEEVTAEVIQKFRDSVPEYDIGFTTTMNLYDLYGKMADSEFLTNENSDFIDNQSITVTAVDANGVKAFWMENDSENVLLYFHGGAYVAGVPLFVQPFALSILSENNLNVLTVDYRMAPEHPYPAAVEDGKAAYRYLLEKGYSPENIVISGDSAGGGLSLATTLALKDEGEQLPAALALMAPWSDLSMSGDTYHTLKEADRLLSKDRLSYARDVYVGNESYQNPYISPIHGDFEDFPPVLLQVANREVLLSEVSTLALNMKADGVDVELEVWECMWHIFQNTPTPEAKDALTNQALFIDKHLSK